MVTKTLIEVQNLSFSYNETDILKDVAFDLYPGEVVCVLGPNGCGKTTFMDCLLGIHPLTNGNIRIKGVDIALMKPHDVAKKVAYVPQTHERTFPYTVFEIVLMGRAAYTGLFSAPSAEDRHIAMQVLAELGLEAFAARPYTQLSGGEAQLVMLARALAQQTEIILMDEPTAHLDYKNELIILDNVVDLVREKGIAILMTTHNPNHAFYFENRQILSRVALMKQRHFIEVGKPETILTAENLHRLYDIHAKVLSVMIEDDLYSQVIPISRAKREMAVFE